MRLFTILCLFFISININAASPLQTNNVVFDVKTANQKFDHINLKLSTQNLNLENLTTAVNTLIELNTSAIQCIEDSQKRLGNINVLIEQGTHANDANKAGADLVYLNNEHKKLASKQAQCRLFSIRAKEAIDAYQTAAARLKQAETLTRRLPLWSIIDQMMHATTTEKSLSTIKLTAPSAFYSLTQWSLLISVCAITAGLLLIRLNKSSLARRYLRIRKLRFSHIVLLTICFTTGLAWIYCSGLFIQNTESYTVLADLFKLIFFYFSTIILITFLFKIKKVCVFFYWNSLDSDFFKALLIFLTSFYMVSIAGKMHTNVFINDDLLLQLGQSIFLLAIVATAISFLYYFCYGHKHLKFIKQYRRHITHICTLLLIACACINILGYQTLAWRLTFSGITTFALVFIAIMMIHSIRKLYATLAQNPTLNKKIRLYFGYKKDQTFTEFLILKITLQIIVCASGLYWIGQTWGFATHYIESVYAQFLYGIHFGNFTLYPTRIVFGILVYCALYLFFRALSTAISRHQQFEDEEETQVAIASILTYIGFGLAIITGLLVAGFNFTGLAIVAGALSVGIGLGLQSIVNNFVSGLILLIEKPIKPGDRINVDGVEGTVKKIRVRSTHVLTPAREDIIIPNSDLITRRVTNYMYTDKQLVIFCEVGVAYGNDVKKVKELLLKIVHEHDDIIKTGRNKPNVLLRSFGENNMIFQVYFLIKDANKKSSVQSDINFAIEQMFRENNIRIAYPQRDVYFKLKDADVMLDVLAKKQSST